MVHSVPTLKYSASKNGISNRKPCCNYRNYALLTHLTNTVKNVIYTPPCSFIRSIKQITSFVTCATGRHTAFANSWKHKSHNCTVWYVCCENLSTTMRVIGDMGGGGLARSCAFPLGEAHAAGRKALSPPSR